MKTITVDVNAEGQVTLTNNGNADVDKQEDVLWSVKQSLTSITIRPYIQPDSGQIDIWSTAPAPFPNTNSKNWQGTVGDVAGEEYYYVDWEKTDGSTGTIDPKITVNR